MKIEEISIESKYYPNKLRNIYDPPKKLYVLGDKEILEQKGIAIVGARKCTKYGRYVALKISKELTLNGINIISGLALGIDTAAHLGNIQTHILNVQQTFNAENSINNVNISNMNNTMNITKLKEENEIKENFQIGKTIAVLGGGIDKIYPKENIELARNIIKTGGCIISEYPTGTTPEKNNFPQRNRIISGLSNGILIVEASKTSGSLITAEFGLEQGKEIFAVPGNITSLTSEGCNELIREGAKITLSSKEILEEIK